MPHDFQRCLGIVEWPLVLKSGSQRFSDPKRGVGRFSYMENAVTSGLRSMNGSKTAFMDLGFKLLFGAVFTRLKW